MLFSIKEIYNKNTHEIFSALRAEQKRQKNEINLIASENYVSNDVLKACGSHVQNKYAEGYCNARYYMGTENVDIIENKCQELVCKLFHCNFANVQPHSGSSANMAAYIACCKYWNCKPADIVGIGFDLSSGGHLTHFASFTFSGQSFQSYNYGLTKKGIIDYKRIEELLLEHKEQKIILSLGYSAYSHSIDYSRLSKFIKRHKLECIICHDVSHFAGMMVAGLYPNPLDYDWGKSLSIITSTTHKTLRCARHAIIGTNDETLYKKINQAVFPYLQGGPLENMIAGVAVGLAEADTKAFKHYQKQVLVNMQSLVKGILDANPQIKLVGDTTDNHLCLLDLTKTGFTGREAENVLKASNIVCNRNTIPGDTAKEPHGIRLGTAFMTSRGWKEKQFYKLGLQIGQILTKN